MEKKRRCLFSVGEDLFAGLEAKRFDKVRQTQELTISDRLSVSADICWYMSEKTISVHH